MSDARYLVLTLAIIGPATAMMRSISEASSAKSSIPATAAAGLDPLPWTGGRLRFLMSSSLLSPDLGDQVQSSAGCGRSLWYRAA